MSFPTAPALSGTSLVLCIISVFFIPFAIAGLALINTGLGRSRSATHAMIAALLAVAVTAIVYLICGGAWLGGSGQAAHVITIAGRTWNWLGRGGAFLSGLASRNSMLTVAVWMQILSVGLAATIPLGSGADRWRLGASCASAALMAGWIYPLFAHWVWGGGWLAELGVQYGLGRGVLDAGGSGVIQCVGGLTALSVTWILGPRTGKYSSEGPPTAIPGHNAVFVLFGCWLAWLGWCGLNGAGAILFAGAAPAAIPRVSINVTLAAAAAALGAAWLTRVRFGKPDASLTANAWVAGMVSVSASSPFIMPLASVVIGAIAGVLIVFAAEWLELKAKVDDPGGAVSVHAVAGIWGLLALPAVTLFPRLMVYWGNVVPASYRGQWLAQLIAVATLLGCVLPMTYLLNWLLNRIYPYRVSEEGERQGMDLQELGAGAYPEFLTHAEDFFER